VFNNIVIQRCSNRYSI